MARRRSQFAVLATVILVVAGLFGGPIVVRAATPAPNRVVIVLFDQMLPQYADQFDMPNFRELRDAGTNFKNAYLGYMASETVIAHNVITSGLEPRSTWAGPTRPIAIAANVFGKGADAMHITGDLSLADFANAREEQRRGLPQARRLPARRPTRARSSSPSARSRTPWSRRPPRAGTSACGCRAGEPTSPRTTRPAAATWRSPASRRNGRWRGPSARTCRATSDGPTDRPDPVRPLLHQLRQGQRLRHQGRVPVVACTRRTATASSRAPTLGQADTRRRHVGGRRGDRDDGHARTGRACSSRWARSTRPAHMWGAQADVAPHGRARTARRADARQVRGRERRRPARQDPRRDRGGRCRQGRRRPWSC